MESRVRGVLDALIAVTLWSLGVVLVKFLSLFYDAFTQNFFRYASASLFLLAFAAKKEGGRLGVVARKSLLLVPFVLSFQTLWVMGVYLTKAAIVAFVIRLSTVVVSVLAYVLFRDERELVSSPRYILGLLLSLAGVAGLTVRPDASVWIDKGAVLALMGALAWALYSVLAKAALRDTSPVSLSATTFALTTPGLGVLALAAGRPQEVTRPGPQVLALLIASGIVSVGIGNVAFFAATREVGAALPSALQLLIPLLTAVLAHALLGEEIDYSEALFSALILAGCALIVNERLKGPWFQGRAQHARG